VIVAVEGATGAGKTTVARALAEATGVPRMAMFVADSRIHRQPGRGDRVMTRRLVEAGIPHNTWLEEIYIAEFVAQTGYHVITDRSMISGLAWAEMRTEKVARYEVMWRALAWWVERATGAWPSAPGNGLLLVHLTAPAGVLVERATRERGGELNRNVWREVILMDSWMTAAKQLGAPVRKFDVEALSASEIVDALKEEVSHGFGRNASTSG